MELKVRSAHPEDLAAVAALWAAAGGPTRLASGQGEAERLLARDPDALIIAETARELVGTLIVGWDGWRCHLYRMAVAAGHRRQGIAGALFEEAAARARSLGANRIDAMVADTNNSAIRYWESLGFEIDNHDHRWSLII